VFKTFWPAALIVIVLGWLGGSAAVIGSAFAQDAGVDTSDWDWGGFEAMDDTPVTQGRRSSSSEPSQAPPVDPRSLENAEPDFDAVPHRAYALFEGMPAIEVIPTVRDEDMHPCSSCHEWVESNPTPRKLQSPHDGFELKHGLHGKGEFWCFTCHHLEGEGGLVTLEGQKLSFDEAYLLCSQCHADQARDWAFGAHGKRVDNWQGERKIYNCTACHYQHRPAIDKRAPMPGPVMRAGLERPPHWVPRHEQSATHELKPRPMWERLSRRAEEQHEHGR
jgi:hypothetical protein